MNRLNTKCMTYESIKERLQTRCSIVAVRMAIQMKNIDRTYKQHYETRTGLYLELMGAYALDLCLWEFGYSLNFTQDKRYLIRMYHGANKKDRKGLDYLVVLMKDNKEIPVLIEAKNWKKQPIDENTYRKDISDRFWNANDFIILSPMEIIMADRLVIMNKENIPQLQKLIDTHKDCINIVPAPRQLTIDMAEPHILQAFLYELVINFIKEFRRIANIRRISVVNYSKKKDYIIEALDMFMPTWLIEKECDTTRQHIYNLGSQEISKITIRYRKMCNNFI